ncbi:hypothetical protein M406DRAFT_53910, partial [Cryphonectria parasitica EP155]
MLWPVVIQVISMLGLLIAHLTQPIFPDFWSPGSHVPTWPSPFSVRLRVLSDIFVAAAGACSEANAPRKIAGSFSSLARRNVSRPSCSLFWY